MYSYIDCATFLQPSQDMERETSEFWVFWWDKSPCCLLRTQPNQYTRQMAKGMV